MTIAVLETASLPDRMEYARALSTASIIPRAFQGKPADVLVAIEYGNALGIAPIVALSEINVINGNPSLSASLMAALARQAGHKVRVEGDETEAVCEIVRSDDPDFTHRAVWSEKKARDAGLWGKGHWAKDPATMLRWRAISECVRFACSEVLGGLKYSSDEVTDFTAPPAKHSVTQVQSLDDAVAEHQTTQQVWEERMESAPEVPSITKAQLTKLAILIRELGMERDESLALFSGWIDRDIQSTKELTVPEASAVIDRLEDAKAAAADPATGEVVAEDLQPEVW